MNYLYEKKVALEELKKRPKKNALVSIIIICNNKTLNDIKLSLSSINIQSFENIEVCLIGINNNSEIKKYISNDKRVKIIKEKVDIHIYASRTHVNIINKIVNKKYALNKLIELEDLKAKIYVIGDNDNDYEMLESFNGGVIKKHHKVLDGLNKKEYNTLGDYIEELMKN